MGPTPNPPSGSGACPAAFVGVADLLFPVGVMAHGVGACPRRLSRRRDNANLSGRRGPAPPSRTGSASSPPLTSASTGRPSGRRMRSRNRPRAIRPTRATAMAQLRPGGGPERVGRIALRPAGDVTGEGSLHCDRRRGGAERIAQRGRCPEGRPEIGRVTAGRDHALALLTSSSRVARPIRLTRWRLSPAVLPGTIAPCVCRPVSERLRKR